MKTVAITFHVPEDIQQRLAELASANERTVSGELRVALRNHLESVAYNDGTCQERSEGRCYATATHRTEAGPVCRRHSKFYTDVEAL